MFTDKKLEDYCEIVLRTGVNLQQGQGLEILCPVEKREIAVALTKKAYELGACNVRVRWEDDEIDCLNYLNAKEEVLCDVPKWFVESKNDLVKKGYCYVAIAAEDPHAFDQVPAQKLSAVNTARSKALRNYSEKVMSNAIRWCVVSVATEKWAKTVFPEEQNAVDKLDDAIASSMRLDCPDPVKAWEEHVKALDKRAKFLNEHNFDKLHFTAGNGTNLTVGLCDEHVWLSAKEKAKDGVFFVANLPTEEVFTAPHRERVDGVVVSAKPLCVNGKLVKDFTVTFKKGKVVNFTAREGYDVLKGLIQTDKGASRLGEVALIGKNSPIAKSGVLFYNTLFDENASCHLAFGKGYPTTIKDGEKLSDKQRKALGLNDSVTHDDFMIGTNDLKVVGIKKNGEEILLFKDGDWTI